MTDLKKALAAWDEAPKYSGALDAITLSRREAGDVFAAEADALLALATAARKVDRRAVPDTGVADALWAEVEDGTARWSMSEYRRKRERIPLLVRGVLGAAAQRRSWSELYALTMGNLGVDGDGTGIKKKPATA